MTGRTTGTASIRGNRVVSCSNPPPPGTGANVHCDTPLKENVTLPKVLRDKAGYHTAAFGKWMLGYNESVGSPNHVGFEVFYGTLHGANGWNYYPPYQWAFNRSQGPDRLVNNELALNVDQTAPGGKPWLCKGVFNQSGHDCSYNQEIYLQEAVSFVRNASQYGKMPFFMYLAFHSPHADDAFHDPKTGYGVPVPTDSPYTNEPWTQAEKNHASMISIIDGYVGQLMSALTECGIENDTLVIFSSDNGATNEGGHSYLFFNSSGPFRGCKACTYEGGIREPMIVRWPGTIHHGVSHYPFAFPDLLPTLAAAAGIDVSTLQGIQGQSVLPTFLGQKQDNHFLYWELVERCDNNDHPTCCSVGRAARMANWKLRWNNGVNSRPELYDLDVDVHEDNDVCAQNQDIALLMIQQAKTMHADDINWPTKVCSHGYKTSCEGNK